MEDENLHRGSFLFVEIIVLFKLIELLLHSDAEFPQKCNQFITTFFTNLPNQFWTLFVIISRRFSCKLKQTHKKPLRGLLLSKTNTY